MHADLIDDDIITGRHRIARLMRENGIKAVKDVASKRPPTATMAAGCG
jgi:hypothetical protein